MIELTLDELELANKIIEASGNNFHCKVANFFVEKGWKIAISPYYVDSSTDKAREIDLVAETYFYTLDDFGQHNGYVRIQLHIECKYITQHHVFWFDNLNQSAARAMISRKTPFPTSNRYINEQHYLKHVDTIAKLFAGEKTTTSTENDPIFKAINQTLHSVVSNKVFVSQLKSLPCKATVQYPVIICNTFDKFFRTSIRGDEPPRPQRSNFQIELHYAYLTQAAKPVSEYFLIDVVSFETLPRFMQMLDHELESMVQIL